MNEDKIHRSVYLTQEENAVLKQRMAEAGLSSFSDYIRHIIGCNKDIPFEFKDPELTVYGDEKRNIRLCFKVTQSEKIHIDAVMKNAGYRCMSAFLLDCVLKKKLVINRGKSSTAESVFRNEMNRLSTQMARHMNNYNQVVQRVHFLSRRTKQNGEPVINTKSLDVSLKKLNTDTHELHEDLAKMVEIFKLFVEKMNKEEASTTEENTNQ